MKRYSVRVDHKVSSPTHAHCAMVEDRRGEWINISDLAEVIEDAYETGYDDKVLFNTHPRGKWYAEFVIDSLKEGAK